MSSAHLLCTQEPQGTEGLELPQIASRAAAVLGSLAVCVHQPLHLLSSSDHTVQGQPWGPHSPAVFPP